MPHATNGLATNALDGTRVYFEDEGGEGAPVILHGGFLDPDPVLPAVLRTLRETS